MSGQLATVTPIKTIEGNDEYLPVASSPLDLPVNLFQEGLARRKTNRQALMAWIKSALVEGVDFGSIKTKRGPTKPSLFKPGAEKICGMLGVTAHFPTLYEYERAVLTGVEFQSIILRCELLDSSNRIVADGVGARSLKQDFGDLNKALKMASKSAHIDATLRMAGLSEVFTQDLEDILPVETPDSSFDASIVKTSPDIKSVKPTPSTPQAIEVISSDQLKTLEGLLYKNRVDTAKFDAWLEKLCSSKGFAGVTQHTAIPSVLVSGILKRIPDFAYSAA